MRRLWMITILGLLIAGFPTEGKTADFMVYSIYKGLDLGDPNDVPQKDFYVNMGSAHGVQPGTVLEVIRKIATYDLTSQKLYKDVAFPIARLKVIHVESNAAIARMDKMNTPDKTPSTTPRAVMVGDLIKLQQ